MNPSHNIKLYNTKRKVYYGVMYTMCAKELTNTIKYEMSVQCLGEEIDNHFLFQLEKTSKTFINDEEVNEIADELADKIARTIFPLVLLVNKKGEWKDVFNADEIKNRWQTNKAKILEEYQGEFVEQYLALAGAKLETKEQLKKTLQKDFFLCAYFRPIFSNLASKQHSQIKYKFPLLPNAESVTYLIQQKNYPETDALGLIRIDQNGTLYNEKQQNATQQEAPKKEGYYKSTYYLNAEDLHIDAAIIESCLQTDMETKVQILISAIENDKKNTSLKIENS